MSRIQKTLKQSPAIHRLMADSSPSVIGIQDVARAAGVSVATVSRVLNQKGIVSHATRDKVLQASRQLNYSLPSMGRENPSRKRTRRVQSRNVVRLTDVARMAGVSTATVSRVLNSTPGVTDAVRRSVESALEQLNYRRHHTAMSLGKGRTGYIAIVEPSGTQVLFSHQYGGRILSGIGRVIDQLPYRLVMTVNEEQFVKLLRSHSVDGIILIGAKPNAFYQEELENLHVPMVIIGSYKKTSNHIVLHPDYVDAMRLSFNHLHELGHESIGYICGPRNSFRRNFDLNLHKQLITKHGTEKWDPILLPETTFAAGYRAFTDLLANNQQLPSALISSADTISLGILQAARDHNFRIPEQLSLVSYGGTDQAAYAHPPLTTVSGDIEAMGADAVRFLVDMIDGHIPSEKRVVYPVRLILRETTRKVSSQ